MHFIKSHSEYALNFLKNTYFCIYYLLICYLKKIIVQNKNVILMSSSSLSVTGESVACSKFKNLLNNKMALVAPLLSIAFNSWQQKITCKNLLMQCEIYSLMHEEPFGFRG